MKTLLNQIKGNETILIIDDEEEILESLRRRFELEGLSVNTCRSPIEALDSMMKYRYNIVITDIKMPGMDGVKLLTAIKSINPLCNILMMTGYSNMTYVVECLSSGAYDYFTKPFEDLDEVVEATQQAIERIERWKKGMGITVRRAY